MMRNFKFTLLFVLASLIFTTTVNAQSLSRTESATAQPFKNPAQAFSQFEQRGQIELPLAAHNKQTRINKKQSLKSASAANAQSASMMIMPAAEETVFQVVPNKVFVKTNETLSLSLVAQNYDRGRQLFLDGRILKPGPSGNFEDIRDIEYFRFRFIDGTNPGQPIKYQYAFNEGHNEGEYIFDFVIYDSFGQFVSQSFYTAFHMRAGQFGQGFWRIDSVQVIRSRQGIATGLLFIGQFPAWLPMQAFVGVPGDVWFQGDVMSFDERTIRMSLPWTPWREMSMDVSLQMSFLRTVIAKPAAVELGGDQEISLPVDESTPDDTTKSGATTTPAATPTSETVPAVVSNPAPASVEPAKNQRVFILKGSVFGEKEEGEAGDKPARVKKPQQQ